MMKRLTISTLVLPVFFLWSCRKEISVTVYPEAGMNQEEIVALLEGALAGDAQGLAAEIRSAIRLMESDTDGPTCGISQDSTRNTVFNTTRFSGELLINSLWLLNCTGQNIPEGLHYSWEGDLRYGSLRLQSQDYTDGTFYLIPLAPGTAYRATGNYQRTGTQLSGLRTGRSFTTGLTVNFTDLLADELQGRIEAGSASFTLNGTAATGESFFVNGSLVFPGSGRASITINTTTYSIQL